MSQKGISFRLNTQITSIAILIIAAIVYFNYHFSNKILVDKIEEGAINQSNLVISRISRITIGAEEIAINISHQALYFLKNNDLDLLLSQVVASNKILESAHIELLDKPKGRLLKFSSNNERQVTWNRDSITLERYLLKQDSVRTSLIPGIWTNPFCSEKDSTHQLVSYKIPIYNLDSKEIVGIVSCEISLRSMQQMLSEVKIGENGYAFIIDKLGNYIIHPKIEWIKNKKVIEKHSAIFREKIEEIQSKLHNGVGEADLGISQYLKSHKAWFYFAPLLNSNWTVIIVYPEKELFNEIEIGFQKIILVSGVGIFILFLLNMFVFIRILDPLIRVTHAIQRFSSIPGKERKTKNEIRMLAESLEDWQMKYGILINDQSKTANEKIKFEKDMKSAQEIQLEIVPSGNPVFPEHPEIDLFAVLKPAEIIGGDLYDYFFIDKNHLLFAIGDVSGKGIPASLFMAIASTLIKTNAKILSAKDIVTKVNEELSERNSNQYFVTLFLGILDVSSGIMDYCNAAHNYPYILHPDGTFKTLSKSHGLPLGIYKDKTYKNSITDLQTGDMIFLYTDGIINSKDAHNQHYGTDKLEKNILNLNDLSSKEVVNRLLKSVVLFEGESCQADDISLMAIKYLNKTKTQT